MRIFAFCCLLLASSPAWAQLRGDALLDQIMTEQRQTLRAVEQSMSVSGSSLTVRQSGDRYVIEVSLPGRAAAEIKVERKEARLILSAPESAGLPAYRQELDISAALPEVQPQVVRQEDKLVITVQRDPGSQASVASLQDREVLARLQQMQQQADAMFQSFFEDNSTTETAVSKSALNLADRGSSYEITAQVPEEIVRNLDITVKEQTLTVQSKADEGHPASLRTAERWSETLALPGPVDASGMIVENRSEGLLIRLPKK